MREITMPDVKLPDIKLPEGLRDMNRADIVKAAQEVRDSLPKRVELPDIDLSRVDLSKIDFSKVQLPSQISDRLPGRKRANPLLPLAVILALGAALAAAWWLITSPITGPRIRRGAMDLKARVTGESTDLVRYDNETDLGSLLTDENAGRTSMSDLGNGTPVRSTGMPEGVSPN
jgi:hypothetical protein